MALLKICCGIMLYVGCISVQEIQGFDVSKDNLNTTTGSLASLPTSSKISIFHCTSKDLCHCHSSKDNSIVADCSYLNIDAIPTFHPNVTVIHLNGNNIKNISGEGIPDTVKYLDLSRNNLDMFIGFPFKDMKQLQYLDLSDNKLRYTNAIYSENIFEGLTQLRYLNIQQNNIHYVSRNLHFPVSISKLNMLETLLLDGVDLSGFDGRFLQMTKLRTLDLSGNSGVCHLGRLRFDYFQNMSNIKYLDISSCNIHEIDIGTFRGLTNLYSLNISFNECLTFRVLPNVTHDLQYTRIRILDISGLHCTFGPSTVIYREDVIHLKNTNLTHVYIDNNRLVMLDVGVAGLIPKTLEFISAKYNSLTFGIYIIELMSSLPSIQIVHADYQKYSHNLQSGKSDCKDWRAPPSSDEKISFSVSTELLDCNRNPLLKLHHDSHILSTYPLPPSLRELYYSYNAFDFEIGAIDFRNINLTVIDVSNNFLHSWKGTIVNVPFLKYIDLSNNYCTHISENFFMVENVLETLLIQNNLLGLVLYEDVNGNIFKTLQSLKIINLSRNHIYTLPALLFRNQHELQILNLSNNALNELSLDISHMKHLQYIDLTHNQLRRINRDQRDQIDSLKDNNLTINLQGNRMDCSCEELDFLKWLGRNKDLFEHFLTYKCAFSNGTEITFSNFDTTLLEISKSCDSYIGIIAVCASVILLSVTFVISGMIYRYRWKLRYLFYMAKTQYRGYRPVVNAEDDDDYLYDAFISYCSDDYMFVVKEMLIHLEDNHGLRLCLHQRDFIPGEDIAQNITNAIHQSRKTVIILSRNYLNSYWCIFEFNMARMESIYSRGGDSVLLLVFYEDIPPRDLPLSLLDIIESKTYIEYPRGDLHGNVVFWDELASSISLRATTSV
ncbi:toll-like receptor 4 [Ylistrum balloti]|uniref:toll-like receptor 4 n=1 Tax=Ylistrum balloti TaxID=509963 RepID=UPI002905DAD2|nr:toll-like receptor 4 [Ylistrum balloti]